VEAVSKRGWWHTWRSWWREFGDAICGNNGSRLEEYLEVAYAEAVDHEAGGDSSRDCIHLAIYSGGNGESRVQHGPLNVGCKRSC